MPPSPPPFQENQWQFLTALETLGAPVSQSVAQALAPVDSRSLDRLLAHCREKGWIQEAGEGLLRLSSRLPEKIRLDLEVRNTDRLNGLLADKIEDLGLTESLGPEIMARIQARAGRMDKAGEIEVERAHQSLTRKDHDEAYRRLSRGVAMLHSHITMGRIGVDRLYTESTLELSNLSYAVGRGMRVLSAYLKTAIGVARNSGDDRSHALACLHMGRLMAYYGRPGEAMALLIQGKEEVERLGDSDIHKAAAEFLGLCSIHQGKFLEAVGYFQTAEQSFAQNQDRLLFYPTILWNLGITLFFNGQVPRALGFFHSYWILARDMGWSAVACIARALLGLALATARKNPQALHHLQEALKDAAQANNEYALFIARAGMAIHAYYEDRNQESFAILHQALVEGRQAATAPMLSSLFIVDMLPEFNRQERDASPGKWNYQRQMERAMKQEGVLSNGVGLRLRGEQRLRNGESPLLAMEDFESSIRQFQKVGAVFAQNKTFIAAAMLHLAEGNQGQAADVAFKVWQRIRGMGLDKDLLPVELQRLLDEQGRWQEAEDSLENFIARYMNALNVLDQIQDEEELLYEVIRRQLLLLIAERGVLFVPDPNDEASLIFRTGCNLSRQETGSPSFRASLDLAVRAFHEDAVIVEGLPQDPDAPAELGRRRALALPIIAPGHLRGVIYLESMYVNDAFDLVPHSLLKLGAEHLARYVHNLVECIRLRQEASRLASFKEIRFGQRKDDSIITRSRAMFQVLEQAEMAARSEATLLVTGETGTGKELLVKRIHHFSNRSKGPMVTVDSTTIPENLVESELFGHEKGAFTGADSRKLGLIEMAHEGTLFIDEIGELPPQTQVKLLRALESRTFHRVGGAQAVKSDFRLVAATNRSLAKEVEQGRFRQDLYYRLNVIHLVLPPLRERGDDVIVLARHFLDHYCSKYGFKPLNFSGRDEDMLTGYTWPGNVRELKNVIERAVILSGGRRPALDIRGGVQAEGRDFFSGAPTMEEVQRRYITKVLEKTKGRIDGPGGAAEILGMKRSTLYSRMYKLGLKDVGKKE
ncbi:regulatory protein, Fis family [Desulfatibacillum alkenivorans DSM 16219]|jgi:transcriptional regulator with GAF, ATPase, and Fis domain|uniref:Regulatory protein, Fis family n=1 Tax=Desulfatibacillum alkenivorans DSM 16219 TaxID=1121393 RepID=A0A1M6DWL5_9BACT|nr:sigma-54-dependent Fis family transcriptional regulator [Desulfatibacillum alkenivorans]SHI77654.1 regulatory protein, Fis family [Desulfatibacillum alkenivorans DSM 16219]